MNSMADLLAVDQRRNFEFFYKELKAVTPVGTDRNELLYHASVMAHHAMVSTFSTDELPFVRDPSQIYDLFVVPNEVTFNTSVSLDANTFESAGAQCLLHVGFFRDQNKRRHNLKWYERLCSGFFYRAAQLHDSREEKRKEFLVVVSKRVHEWAGYYATLSRELRIRPYLLNLSTDIPVQ